MFPAVSIFAGTNPLIPRIQMGVGIGYDDNILRYSDADRDHFVNNTRRYASVIETYDDLATTVRLRLRWEWSLGLPGRTQVQFWAKHKSYLINSIKDYQTYTFWAKQDLGAGFSLKVQYFYIPSFYLRHYQDIDRVALFSGDPRVYRACDFTENQYTGGLYWRFRKRLEVGAYLRREELYYNSDFTEYDTISQIFGCKFTMWLLKGLRVGLDYCYQEADNIGRDPSPPSGSADLSFVQDTFKASIRPPYFRILTYKFYGDAAYRLRLRYYSSEAHPFEDSLHAGRHNRRGRIVLGLETRPFPRLKGRLEYFFECREVISDYPWVVDLKEFSNHRYSLEFSYSL